MLEVLLHTWLEVEALTCVVVAAYASMTKALLNMTLDGKAERYDDDGRRQLKEKLVSTMGERPDKIPVPSDIAQLAKSLVACRARLSDASEAEVELDPERKLLGVCYSRAVDDLLARLKGSINKARKMIAQLITDPEEQAAALTQVVANSVRVAIDCTASMAHTHPTCCLMTMLFADVFYADASGPNLDVSMITFSNNARIVPIPPPSLDSPEDRLASMLDSCRAQANNTDGAFNAEQGPTSQASYLAALEAFSAEPSFEGTDLLICSDFVGQSFTEDLAAWKASTEGVSTSVVSCWRMLANRSSRKRGRAISWDPANPLIDVCFVMDTTGSMGTWIHYACSEVRNVVQQVESSSGMPVRCSMVSYKDFGDHRHRCVCAWFIYCFELTWCVLAVKCMIGSRHQMLLGWHHSTISSERYRHLVVVIHLRIFLVVSKRSPPCWPDAQHRASSSWCSSLMHLAMGYRMPGGMPMSPRTECTKETR